MTHNLRPKKERKNILPFTSHELMHGPWKYENVSFHWIDCYKYRMRHCMKENTPHMNCLYIAIFMGGFKHFYIVGMYGVSPMFYVLFLSCNRVFRIFILSCTLDNGLGHGQCEIHALLLLGRTELSTKEVYMKLTGERLFSV